MRDVQQCTVSQTGDMIHRQISSDLLVCVFNWNTGAVLFAGKQLQMNRMPTPEGDEGGEAQARVNVLAELPLLEARLDAPSLKTPDVDQSQVTTLLLMHHSGKCNAAECHLYIAPAGYRLQQQLKLSLLTCI